MKVPTPRVVTEQTAHRPDAIAVVLGRLLQRFCRSLTTSAPRPESMGEFNYMASAPACTWRAHQRGCFIVEDVGAVGLPDRLAPRRRSVGVEG